MKFSYKLSSAFFFSLYIIPIVLIGFLVQFRIHGRQTTLQLFLQNQIDVDRQILAQREPLRELNSRIHSLILRNASLEERKIFLVEAKKMQEDFQIFWGNYETRYAAAQRPFLKEILQETQETRLEEEELQTVRGIKLRIDAYFAVIKTSMLVNTVQPVDAGTLDAYLEGLIEKQNGVYDSLNTLADIRFIFSQRIVFLLAGRMTASRDFLT